MRVAVLHNLVGDDDSADDRDVLVQAEAVCQALLGLGHEPIRMACTLNLQALQAELLKSRPHVVFNLVESLGGYDRLQALVPALLDAFGQPYTGNSADAFYLTNSKPLAKERLLQAGLPTPAWFAADQVAQADAGGSRNRSTGGAQGRQRETPNMVRGRRYIVKPAAEHASYGMDETSVVSCNDLSSLQQRLREQAARLGCPCFAEEYIEGREFNLSLLTGPQGPEVLPPAEIDFSAFPEGKLRIVDYRAKWEEGCFEFVHTPRVFDFEPADATLLEELRALARACWGLFRLRGYVRVDFRVDSAGRPWILEINTNPCLSPDAGFAAALQRSGIPFEQAVQRILEEAVSVGSCVANEPSRPTEGR